MTERLINYYVKGNMFLWEAYLMKVLVFRLSYNENGNFIFVAILQTLVSPPSHPRGSYDFLELVDVSVKSFFSEFESI